MRRIGNAPRRGGWQEANAALGLVYNDTVVGDGTTVSYWREGSYYEFSLAEILELERAAMAIHEMLIAAGDEIIERCPRRDQAVRSKFVLGSICPANGCLLSKIGVPEYAHNQIIRTWLDGDAEAWTRHERDPDISPSYRGQLGDTARDSADFSPNIYGRFDLWYAGEGTTPKLLEYNAQTPTSLLEASVIQWHWQEQTAVTDHPERQWNGIHEALIEAWRRNMAKLREARPWLPQNPKIYFAYETAETSGEDLFNTAYMQETARAAGFSTELIGVGEIGWDAGPDAITDAHGEPIHVIFALYPWEWLWHEEGGKPIFRNMADPEKRGTVWIQPPYSAALIGNKAVLAVVWQLFGHRPEFAKYLLPAYFDADRPKEMTDYALKPIWGREGSSVLLVEGNRELEVNHGSYGKEGFVAQQLCPLPAFEGVEGVMHPVIGVWMVDGEPVGMGIRESAELITGNTSHFIPHVIV